MNVLALDLGTRTGWARSIRENGVIDLSLKRGETGGLRFLRWRRTLYELLDGVDLVAYEAVNWHRGAYAAEVYYGLLAILEDACADRKPPVQMTSYTPAEWRRLLTGRGRMSKEQAVEEARKRLPGIVIIDHNHAEALLIWLVATGEISIERRRLR